MMRYDWRQSGRESIARTRFEKPDRRRSCRREEADSLEKAESQAPHVGGYVFKRLLKLLKRLNPLGY